VAGTWGTLVREVLEEANKVSSTAAESDRVKRAIVAALEFFRTKNFLTLETYWSVTLLAGQRIYSTTVIPPGGTSANLIVPINLTSIEGQTIDLDRAGNANSRWELTYVPNEKMDIFLRGFAYVSQPDFWTWYGQQLYLYPTPDLTGDIVRGRGVIDAGVPGKSWTGAAWAFTKPVIGLTTDGAAMTDDYPNPANGGGTGEYHFWLGDGGYETLKSYTLYSLFQGVWQARDGAIAAQKALFDEKLQALVERHGRAKAARQVEPYRGEWGWIE
jgi:hypothetical protein